MKAVRNALDKLANSFEGFTEELRNIADEFPQDAAGAGEEPDGYDAEVAQAPARNDISDDKIITMRSGDLREVIDAYRRLSRFAREGRIPTQDQRMKGHLSVRKVKHLVRKPIR